MLSRIAESLYWVGRYVERAEDTARILDVHVHNILEDTSVEEEAACRSLLDTMGADHPDGDLDTAAVTRVLAFDGDQSGSIVASLRAARENARGSREILSSEMWECLNATHHALDAQVERAAGRASHHFFQWVKERGAIVAGLADSTMTRDDAWRFLVLGRSLERVDMTARLLRSCFADPSGAPDWVTTLRSCSAQEAFLRTYRRAPDAALVVEFLLLDRLFPRSALYALDVAERRLGDLDPRGGRVGSKAEARRALGRARTELEFSGVSDLLDDLSNHLQSLQAACAEAGEAVARRFFHRTAAMEWSVEEATARP
ncbi:MAG TPA: alpha-E domain-containing protein [Acidimicrobiales bacterium]|nr:alpha-E domain-containing protein [Acidimicrobiales bacterium]